MSTRPTWKPLVTGFTAGTGAAWSRPDTSLFSIAPALRPPFNGRALLQFDIATATFPLQAWLKKAVVLQVRRHLIPTPQMFRRVRSGSSGSVQSCIGSTLNSLP